MSSPTFSIIMPVFNAGEYVGKALRSILNQTFTDFELILVDDGSTDNSQEVLARFSDSRIRLLANHRNRGIVYSRNRGLEVASGRYIAPFDADDIAHPQKYVYQISFLEKHPEYGMIGSWARLIDEQGRMLKKRWKLKAPPGQIPAILLFRNYFVQSAVLIRREAIPQGGYKAGMDTVEDYWMWACIARHYQVWNYPAYLVNYRIHDKSITHRDSLLMPKRDARVYQFLFEPLHMELTNRQLKILNILKNNEPVREISNLREIEDFLLRLLDQNSMHEAVDHQALKVVVRDRWAKACFLAYGSGFRAAWTYFKSPLF